MYLNKAIVIGNLTRDPELKALPTGVKVCTFSIATNRVWKDQATGTRKEAVEYHNIVVFNRPAETSAQYLRKGSNVLVEGRMQTRSWDAQDGQKKYRTEIVAESVQFGARPGGASSGSPASNDPSSADGGGTAGTATVGGKADAPSDAIEYPEEEINPDDIPF